MTCGRNAVNHIYCGNFAFSLQKRTAYFRHSFSHICGNFGLRGYGVAKIAAAARIYSAKGHGLVALDEHTFGCSAHALPPLVFALLNTRMATSGHMTAHEAQPVHWPSISITS